MKLNNQQKAIISSIEKEFEDEKRLKWSKSTYHAYVYFSPRLAVFLYADEIVFYNIIEPLIRSEILIFQKFHNHQGEKMLRYALNKQKISK